MGRVGDVELQRYMASSRGTILNCLGELGEIRERAGIAADGNPAGAAGATVLSVFGRERCSTVGRRRVGRNELIFSAGIACFGDILRIEGPLVEIGSRSVFVNQVVGGRQSPAGEGLRMT